MVIEKSTSTFLKDLEIQFSSPSSWHCSRLYRFQPECELSGMYPNGLGSDRHLNAELLGASISVNKITKPELIIYIIHLLRCVSSLIPYNYLCQTFNVIWSVRGDGMIISGLLSNV